MKKVLIIPAIILSLNSVDVFAENVDEPLSCVYDVLGVSEDGANSDINPEYRPNMISIEYNNRGTESEIISVQYDGTIITPETTPTRLGYTFKNWKISGVKTCADFSSDENTCKTHINCIWKDNACVPNPCINSSSYNPYNYETNSCINVLSLLG
nr:InlB B-repeat-containing protein [Candidatus Enterousia merdequi]